MYCWLNVLQVTSHANKEGTDSQEAAHCNMAHKNDCYFISSLEIGFLFTDPHVSNSVTNAGSLELNPLSKSHKPCAAELQSPWPHRATDKQL